MMILRVSQADIASKYGLVKSGDYTTGMIFQTLRDTLCDGLRFNQLNTAASSVKCCLYPLAGGSPVATATVSTTGVGIYTATFTTPFAIAALTRYFATMYDTGNTYSTYNARADLPVITYGPWLLGDNILVLDNAAYAAGDNSPNKDSSSERYTVDPILES